MNHFVESVSGFRSRLNTLTKGRIEMEKIKQGRVNTHCCTVHVVESLQLLTNKCII